MKSSRFHFLQIRNDRSDKNTFWQSFLLSKGEKDKLKEVHLETTTFLFIHFLLDFAFMHM